MIRIDIDTIITDKLMKKYTDKESWNEIDNLEVKELTSISNKLSRIFNQLNKKK